MPQIKLSFPQVRNIKKLLLEGQLTHAQIAKKYGVSRGHITKIGIGMKDPDKNYGKWKHIEPKQTPNKEE
jgi:predicted transcriptional regulator